MSDDKNIVITDLDGTLALIDHRRHFVDKAACKAAGLKTNWRKFFDECDKDEPNWPVIHSINALAAQGKKIVIFSGRSAKVKSKTKKWLAQYGVHYDHLFMRPVDDSRPDDVLKKEMLDHCVDKDRVLMVFDDRQRVVDLWRKEGLTCFQVAPGDF